MMNIMGNKRLIAQNPWWILKIMCFYLERLYGFIRGLLVIIALFLAITANSAYAAPVTNVNNDTRCLAAVEPNLKASSTATVVTHGSGFDIINGVFEAVNQVMATMTMTFYQYITSNNNYLNAVNALTILYLSVYGVMLLYGHAPARAGDVISRLMKIGLLWSLLGAGGWKFFNDYVDGPVIGIMNDLIRLLAVAGGNGVPTDMPTTGNFNLSPISMNMLMGSMNMVFSMRFMIAIFALAATGTFGWFFALVILWGLVEFLLMIFGAIITYVKAVVAISFLFSFAPIFFSFILFEKTKQIFMQWANSIMGFIMQPILLFGFIGFYSSVLTDILTEILFKADYCWLPFFHFGWFSIPFWRPVNIDAAGNCHMPGGNCDGGDWFGDPPISIMNVFYFLLLTHLGKNLSKFIENLSKDVTGGYQGAGVVRGAAVGGWMANHIPGVKGRGPADLIGDGFLNIKHRISAAARGRNAKRETVRRQGINNTPGSSGGGGKPEAESANIPGEPFSDNTNDGY